MALRNICFLLLTALVAVNIIFAEESFDEVLSDTNQVDLSDSVSRKARFLFPLITTCNFTANPGSTCANCFQAVRCLPNNNGVVRNCYGLLRYCNAGRCSIYPDPVACNGTITG